MKGLARVTGIVFICMGLVVVVIGVIFLARAGLRPEPVAPSLFGGPDIATLLLPLRLLAGAFLSLQGLMLAAVGEGLWLIASMAQETESAARSMAGMAEASDRPRK